MSVKYAFNHLSTSNLAFEVIYLDSRNKSVTKVLYEVVLAFEMLKIGGILIIGNLSLDKSSVETNQSTVEKNQSCESDYRLYRTRQTSKNGNLVQFKSGHRGVDTFVAVYDIEISKVYYVKDQAFIVKHL